jgi:hypothetical protein
VRFGWEFLVRLCGFGRKEEKWSGGDVYYLLGRVARKDE